MAAVEQYELQEFQRKETARLEAEEKRKKGCCYIIAAFCCRLGKAGQIKPAKNQDTQQAQVQPEQDDESTRVTPNILNRAPL